MGSCIFEGCLLCHWWRLAFPCLRACCLKTFYIQAKALLMFWVGGKECRHLVLFCASYPRHTPCQSSSLLFIGNKAFQSHCSGLLQWYKCTRICENSEYDEVCNLKAIKCSLEKCGSPMAPVNLTWWGGPTLSSLFTGSERLDHWGRG